MRSISRAGSCGVSTKVAGEPLLRRMVLGIPSTLSSLSPAKRNPCVESRAWIISLEGRSAAVVRWVAQLKED